MCYHGYQEFESYVYLDRLDSHRRFSVISITSYGFSLFRCGSTLFSCLDPLLIQGYLFDSDKTTLNDIKHHFPRSEVVNLPFEGQCLVQSGRN